MVILWGRVGRGVAFRLLYVANGAAAVMAKVAEDNIKENNVERNLTISHSGYSVCIQDEE